jgi:hypothetical protein
MNDDVDIVEAIAAMAYAHSFSARVKDEGWKRVKRRAEDGGGYAGVVVERCYRQAADTLRIVRAMDAQKASTWSCISRSPFNKGA